MKFKKQEKEDNTKETDEPKEEEISNILSIAISETSEKEKKENDSKKENHTKKDNNRDINIERQEKKKALKMINNIDEIIKFCNEKGTLLIYFTNDCWKYILYHYKEATEINI